MKIDAGIFKGRKLSDSKYSHIRPTTDRVRDAIFVKLQFFVAGKSVLDLFSGTGALGIEALSRGATQVWFVDRDARSIGLTKANLGAVGVPGSAGKNPKNKRKTNHMSPAGDVAGSTNDAANNAEGNVAKNTANNAESNAEKNAAKGDANDTANNLAKNPPDEKNIRVTKCDALAFLEKCTTRFDLILVDPPYASGLYEKVLQKIAEKHLLAKDGIIVCEHSTANRLKSDFFSVWDEKKYGDITVTYFENPR